VFLLNTTLRNYVAPITGTMICVPREPELSITWVERHS
jgi:hypothetical protein